MALPPKFAAHKLVFAEPPSSLAPTHHTLEVYLDYCCPFSAKMFRTLTGAVDPLVRSTPRWRSSLALVFRQQVQPWHPSSTLMHEAALAVLELRPELFWAFSAELFEAQKGFFDASVVNETRNDTYRRLADVAHKVGVDKDQVYGLLRIDEDVSDESKLNVGNRVTNNLKLVTRMNRLSGVHVTPTVVFNGVVHDISSSWGEDQWKEWLTNNVV